MNLKEFFESRRKIGLAFSGGVDSSYLLYAAVKYGVDVKAYYVKSDFQPRFELEDAMKLAAQLGAKMEVITEDVLQYDVIAANRPDRCYHCKRRIFTLLATRAAAQGYTCIIDGTNATDDVDDRPGMKALTEMKVLSPLRLCGITKDQVRRLSKEAGLFTWDKPAYACLATRIPVGRPITVGDLNRIELAENIMHGLGFRDFRVRMSADGREAKLEIREDQMSMASASAGDIRTLLAPYFEKIFPDLEGR